MNGRPRGLGFDARGRMRAPMNKVPLWRALGVAALVSFGSGCPADATSTEVEGSTGPEGTGSSDAGPMLTSSTPTTAAPADSGDSTMGEPPTATTGDATGDETGTTTSCCSAHASPGCDIMSVQTCVCDRSASCCAFEWDEVCADQAINDCGGCDVSDGTTDTGGTAAGDTDTDDDGGLGGDCCVPAATPGCDDAEVETCVCGQDDFCCAMEWDDVCVGIAAQCGADCKLPELTCCEPQGAGGCLDREVSDCTCLLDTDCCDVAWSPACVALSVAQCENACEGIDFTGEGDCCEPHPSAGCDDADIQICTCAADPFCCAEEWDDVCVEGATDVCGAPCDGGGSGTDGGSSGTTAVMSTGMG